MFLRARVLFLLPLALAGAFICLMMAVLGCAFPAIVFAGAVMAGALCAALLLEYARNRRFYRDMEQLARKLEHPYQMPSLMCKPAWPDQACVYDALRAMGNASASEVALERAAKEEQREYMEQWVHEIKAPLAAAMLVANHVEEPESSQLKTELDRSLYEVDQVLWYARSLSAQVDYRIRMVNLGKLARAVCKQNARFLIERNVMPSFDASVDEEVLTDEKQVAFIVSQAVVNAAKYGATRIEFSACSAVDAAGAQRVTLRIADDGWGIPEADLPRVFDRGFTGARGRQVGSSTGMGLYLAATLCKNLGLGLSLASSEGEGTVVKISFPFDDRRADASMAREAPINLHSEATQPSFRLIGASRGER